MTEVNKQKAKKAAQIAKRVGLVLTAATAATTFVACPPDPTCECAPGTEHLSGDLDGTECCDLCADNHCTIVDGKTVEGIKVINTGNVDNFDTVTTNVDNALKRADAIQLAYIKENITEIRVSNATSGNITLVNGVLTIRVGHNHNAIWTFLEEWLDDNGLAMLFKQFDNSKNNVRFGHA
ncbi:MAG: hypothetical protein FWC01_07290 [Treponema sp.]|nr:hypothetical protein [Treponema sp.]MCL2252772.1 hypothetical protein [Treponema sp.]